MHVVEKNQFGFKIGRGIRHVICILRIIWEKYFDINEDICFCFIDWEKAFNRLKESKPVELLNMIGID